jgi:TRAP-type C4-dicarboxylate transport system permease small subunit
MMQAEVKTQRTLVQRLGDWVILAVRAWGALGGLSILALAALTSVDVVLRYFFNRPLLWGYDVSSYIMGACVFFGAAYTELHESHVSITFITSRLSAKRKAWTMFFLRLIMLAVCIILAFACWLKTISSWRTNSTTIGIVKIPKFPLDGILTLSMLLFSALIIVKIVGYIKEVRSSNQERG